MPVQFIGVDVSKAWLEVAVHGQSRVERVANEVPALQAWLSRLPAGCVVGMESTGRYHGLVCELAHAAGHRVYVLNARDVSCYARALGRRAKTDRVDALLIARYLEREHGQLHAWAPDVSGCVELSGLLKQREVVVKQRVQLRASLSESVGMVRVAYQAALRGLEELLRALDKRIAALQQAASVKHLRSIPGVGPVGAAALSCLLERYAFGSADAAVAFAGLDPQARESGQWQGRRRLSKSGPAHLRGIFYMVAMAAANQPAWQGHYQRWRARGLAPTQAYVALARKLIRTAYALLKQGCDFDPERHAMACATT